MHKESSKAVKTLSQQTVFTDPSVSSELDMTGRVFFLFTGFLWNSNWNQNLEMRRSTEGIDWLKRRENASCFICDLACENSPAIANWVEFFPFNLIQDGTPVVLQVMQTQQFPPSPSTLTVSVKPDLSWPLSYDIDPNSRGFLQLWERYQLSPRIETIQRPRECDLFGLAAWAH